RLNGRDTGYGVNCVTCGLNNRGFAYGYATPAEAITAWNRRALTAAQQQAQIDNVMGEIEQWFDTTGVDMPAATHSVIAAAQQSTQQGGGEVVAWGVFGKSAEYPKPVLLPDYVGSMDTIRQRVMEKARREGFRGNFVE